MSSSVNDTDSWFLAQLKPNAARIAERNLTRQGYRTFLPLEEQTVSRGGKFVTAMKPLFPGYIFVAFDAARGLWRTVNSTYGVSRLVSFGREPAAVPGDLVAQLIQRCDSGGKLQPVQMPSPGDKVTLTSGPFANFVAEVERISADQRVWVLMELMGAKTRVAVDAQQLRTG